MADNAEATDVVAGDQQRQGESHRNVQGEQDTQQDVRTQTSLTGSTGFQGDSCPFATSYKDEAGNPKSNVFTTEFAEGRTLLEFFVYSRRPEKDIQGVVDDIVSYVGFKSLVFQLQKSDAWGAPLLFQAVFGKRYRQSESPSSRQGASSSQGRHSRPGVSPQQSAAPQSRASRFKFVAEIISSHLGKDGLAEQLRSIDREGRSLRMYAARSREEGLYEEVEKMMKENDVLDNLEHRDNRGYTLLHHAAESGSLATLKAVTKSLRTQSDFRGKFLGKKDRHGMTPANRLLSKQVGESEIGECQEKLEHLMNICTCPEDSCSENPCPEENLKGLDVEGVIFAARGGVRNIFHAIQLRSGHTQSQRLNNSQQVWIRRSLEHVLGNGDKGASQVERFLVQAALGGQTDVVQAVLEDKPLSLEHGDTTAPSGGTSPINGGASPDDGSTNRDGGGGGGGGGGDGIRVDGGASPGNGGANGDEGEGGGGGADREGSILDSFRDLARVMKRTDFGFEAIELSSVGDDRGGNNPAAVEEDCKDCKGSLFTLTILSGNENAIFWAKKYTLDHVTQGTEAWDMIRGKKGCLSSLTYAASAPAETGTAAFKAVLQALKEVARLTPGVGENLQNVLREEFKGGGKQCCKRERLPPLVAAAFCGNDKLFQEIRRAYSTEFNERWCPDEVFGQILRGTLSRRKSPKAVCPEETRFLPRGGNDEAGIPTAMWRKIIETISEFQTCHHSGHLLDEWKRSKPSGEWRALFANSIQEAVVQGDFQDFRAFMRMKFCMGDMIPSLFAYIGDNEERLTNAIMFAIKESRNPLIPCAVTSRDIIDAKGFLPAHQEGLDRLQAKIDDFSMELLNHLPRTVRDFGRKLVGARPHAGYEKSYDEWQERRERLSFLVGYMIVRQLLEPNQSHISREYYSAEGRECMDPIQQAMERGSGALDFINSPLVLDYMHITFSRTLPHWLARDPFRFQVNTGFHEYFAILKIPGENFLLRIMQGWDARRTRELRMPLSAFPPSMILPGLQFSLAGIIGKPDAFFMVPAVRFAFMLWSYMAMVGLYVFCLPPKDSDDIPLVEIFFYIFSLGLLHREILEFQDTLPHQKLMFNPGDYLVKEYKWSITRRLRYTTARHRVSTALKRYLLHDTWNILDILTVFTILVALVTRLMGMGGRWSSSDGDEDDDSATDDASVEFARWAFFFSRYALAAVAPMLFARFLFLSQIDPTLGPMSQVIWNMIFHLARFSFFLLVHLIGFALTFYTIFSDCKGDLSGRFETFSTSLLTLFRSMLGDFDFDIFSDEYSSCEGSSYAAYEVGIFLMVVYLVVMSILLLNLLIAVLSTVHSEVHKNSVPEFNLAAGKIIFKNEKAVEQGLVPPPFNLLMLVIGLLVELFLLLPSTVRYICNKKQGNSNATQQGNSNATQRDNSNATQQDNSNASQRDNSNATQQGNSNATQRDNSNATQQDNSNATQHGNSNETQRDNSNATQQDNSNATQRDNSNATQQGISNATQQGNSNATQRDNSNATQQDNSNATQQGNSSATQQDNSNETQRDNSNETQQDNSNETQQASIATVIFSGQYWFSFEGLLLRICFAFTMGLSSIVIYAFLWVISTPLIAWRAFQDFFPPGFEQKDEGITWEAGYLRPLLVTLGSLAGWMVAMLVVSLYSLVHMFFLILLWLRGLLSTFEWYMWSCRITKQKREECQKQQQPQQQQRQQQQRQQQQHSSNTNAPRDPRSSAECFEKSYENERCAIMPGEERMSDDDCPEAMRIVSENNYPQNPKFGPVCFNVDGFLTMTTGRSVAYLIQKVQGRDKEGRKKYKEDYNGSPHLGRAWPEALRIAAGSNRSDMASPAQRCFNVDDLLMTSEGRRLTALIHGKETTWNDREMIFPPPHPIRHRSA